MIAFVRGRVADRRPDGREAVAFTIDVGGIGYRVLVPSGLAARLPSVGSDAEVHTAMVVREDSMTLYGFPSPAARELFDALLMCSGIGPKLALAALSAHSPDSLRRAIVDGDVDALTLVPGIGRKSAQRLVLELRDRLGGTDAEIDGLTGSSVTAAAAEVRLALMGLGYTNAEAHRGLEAAGADGQDVDALLRAALRALGGRPTVAVGEPS